MAVPSRKRHLAQKPQGLHVKEKCSGTLAGGINQQPRGWRLNVRAGLENPKEIRYE